MMDFTTLIDPLVKSLGAALAAIISAYVVQFLRKRNILLDDVKVQNAVRQGIGYAEEYAARYAKEFAGKKLSGQAKHNIAADVARQIAPQVSEDVVQRTITAMLPEMRVPTYTPPPAPVVADPDNPKS